MEDILDEKEKGEEARYKLDQERLFKIAARRNKLLGLWVAGRLGLAADEAGAYAGEIVMEGMGGGGDDVLAARILSDFQARSLDVSEAEIRAEIRIEMARLSEVATEQIAEEYPRALDTDHSTAGG